MQTIAGCVTAAETDVTSTDVRDATLPGPTQSVKPEVRAIPSAGHRVPAAPPHNGCRGAACSPSLSRGSPHALDLRLRRCRVLVGPRRGSAVSSARATPQGVSRITLASASQRGELPSLAPARCTPSDLGLRWADGGVLRARGGRGRVRRPRGSVPHHASRPGQVTSWAPPDQGDWTTAVDPSGRGPRGAPGYAGARARRTSRGPRRLVAALTGLQCRGLVGFAAFYVYELAVGEGSDAARVIMSALLILLGGLGLGGARQGLVRRCRAGPRRRRSCGARCSCPSASGSSRATRALAGWVVLVASGRHRRRSAARPDPRPGRPRRRPRGRHPGPRPRRLTRARGRPGARWPGHHSTRDSAPGGDGMPCVPWAPSRSPSAVRREEQAGHDGGRRRRRTPEPRRQARGRGHRNQEAIVAVDELEEHLSGGPAIGRPSRRSASSTRTASRGSRRRAATSRSTSAG